MKLRPFLAAESPPAGDKKSRRAARMAKPTTPLKKRFDNGGERFAPFDLREMLALATLRARQGAAWAVLGWMKVKATKDDRGDFSEVEVSDLDLCQRTGLSWNTIARAIGDLSSIGLFSSAVRRQGAKGRYRLTYGLKFDVGKPSKSSPEVGEHGASTETPASPEVGELLPRSRGTAPQFLSTRSASSEQGAEKSAMRFAQARSSVIQGPSGSLDSEGRCALCRESTMPGFVEVQQPGGMVGLSRCPGEEHRQPKRPAAVAERRRTARESS